MTTDRSVNVPRHRQPFDPTEMLARLAVRHEPAHLRNFALAATETARRTWSGS